MASKTNHLVILSRTPVDGKFSVRVNGYDEMLTLERIKDYIAHGAVVTER